MTSATVELRRLLDERGVEYEEEYKYFGHYLTWGENDCYSFAEYPAGAVLRIWDCTPEQAIAATLGDGECENVGELGDFCCSECGARLYTEMSDGYTMIECDEKTIIKLPRYCPNCGKAVKR